MSRSKASSGLPPHLVLLAVEVGACLGHLPGLPLSAKAFASAAALTAPTATPHVKENEHKEELLPPCVVLIMGCGRVGLMAMCLVRHMAPNATILAADISQDRLHLARSLNKATKVQQMYVNCIYLFISCVLVYLFILFIYLYQHFVFI